MYLLSTTDVGGRVPKQAEEDEQNKLPGRTEQAVARERERGDRAEIVKIPVAISIITNAVVLPVFSQTSTAQTCINGA